MRVLVTGATGLVGRGLLERLSGAGHSVDALSRGAPRAKEDSVEWHQGDPAKPGDWEALLESCDAVVHLAGASIGEGRWNAARKRELVDSRVESARRIAAGLAARSDAASTAFICASATGYYGERGDEVLDEDAAPGGDFLARLCVDWEAAARTPEAAGVRCAQVRLGIVLERDGGALAKMLPPFKLGVGGPIGPSDRYFPWIHGRDAVGLFHFAVEATVSGPLNAVAPEAATMGAFAGAIGKALGRPSWLPVPLAAVRIGIGEFGNYVSPGQRVVPRRAQELGYRFEMADLGQALSDVLA